MIPLPHGLALKDALAIAQRLGCRLRYKGGDVLVVGPGWIVRHNHRRKDASRTLIMALRRLQTTLEAADGRR